MIYYATWILLCFNVWGDFWALVMKILVFPSPSSYMLTAFNLSLLNWVYSLDYSKAIRTFLEVLNFNWLFLNLNLFSPFIGLFGLFDTAISFKSPNQFLGVDL
jgi:hypothetical protein